MHVIALQGPGNAGKTTTIGMVAAALEAIYPGCVTVVSVLAGSRRETSVVIEMKLGPKRTIRVGIESRGDMGAIVKKSLQAFVVAKCQVVLCATRTSGGPVKELNAIVLATGCTLEVRQKLKALPALHVSENGRMASLLLSDLTAAF